MQLIKKILIFVLVIHIQHIFLLVFGFQVFKIQKIIEVIKDYNPIDYELAMFILLPYSFISTLIIPFFVSFYKKKHIKSINTSFVLFIVVMMLLYFLYFLFGFILDLVFNFSEELSKIFKIWPLSAENRFYEQFKFVFSCYLLGNTTFSLFFVPTWHYYLKKFFIILKQ